MPYIHYPYLFYEYPLHIRILASITNFLGEPVVLFTAFAAFAAIVAAIAAVRANAPNSREKTDILKCEIFKLPTKSNRFPSMGWACVIRSLYPC